MFRNPTTVDKQLLAGLTIFKPSVLVTKDDITAAVTVLQDTLDSESIGNIIHISLQPEHPYVFEFILSCKLGPFSFMPSQH
jgi:hypothetical protein